MPRLHRYCALVGSVAALAVSARARAAAPAELSVSARGPCPAAERVQRQLVPLLAQTNVHVGPRAATEMAWVADHGQEFTVKVRQVERVIKDAARDCEERARIAAVFIALVVDPPLPSAADSGATEPPASPRPIPVESEPAAPSEPGWLGTLAGATGAWAAGRAGERTWGIGPALRLMVGRSEWDVSLAAAFVTPIELDLKRAAVRVTRVPLDLSASFVFGGESVRGFVGAGMAGDLLHLSGAQVSRAQSAVRFDVGLRSHLGLRVLFRSGIWGVAEMSGSFFPRPYEFEVPPGGIVGQTPSLWLGGTVGALFMIR